MKLPDGWKYIKLSELFDEVSEKNHSDAEVLTIVQGVGTVLRKDSGRDIIYDKNSLSNYKYVQKDDFIIHLRSFEGGLEIANQEGIVSPAYIILHPKIQAEPGYLYALFHSNRFINQTMAPAVEGVRDGRTVKYEVLKNQSIPFPPLAEQQKIAEILCRQDKIISLKQKLLEQKLQQKKWLIQKLLEVPHTNVNCEEKISLGGVVINKSGWKKERIKDVSTKIIAGATPSTKIKDFWNGNISWMSSGEINKRIIFETEVKISQLGYESCSTKIVPPKSVLIALAGQGKTRGMVAVNEIALCTNQSLASVIPKNIDYKFLFYFLDSKYSDLRMISSGDGSRGGLNLEIISNYEIYLPTLPEQKIIAQVLSAADKEIALIKSSIEQEKQKKKSLAQLLLTGTVRVKI